MAEATIYKVPVKGGGAIEVTNAELLAFDDAVYRAIVTIGLKDLMNRGMTKIKVRVDGKALEGEDAEKSKAAALVIATKNFANLKEGKLPRMVGAKAADGKVPGVVMTEARRLAKNLIKDEIKAAGGKISYYETKDITAAANAFLETEEGKAMIVTAQANVDARSKAVEAKAPASLEDLQSKLGINVSATKLAQAEAKKAKQKAAGDSILSAAAAGKVKARTKAPAKAGAQAQAPNPQQNA